MMHLYDTRWATYLNDGATRLMTANEKAERALAMPRYWVLESDVRERRPSGGETALLAWRRVARTTDERTLIATAAPEVAYGDSVFLMSRPRRGQATLQSILASFALDYVARQKFGGVNASFFLLQQLAVPSPTASVVGLSLDREAGSWLGVRVDRLNAWVADDLERAQLRAEIDAYCFHLYGLGRDDVEYVMESFPIVKRKDEDAVGEYRTKRLVLEAYDAMSAAIAHGTRYCTPFQPTEVMA